MAVASDTQDPLLTARADGLVRSSWPARLPFMAPRLQGEVGGARHVDLSLWGAGRLGRVRFSPLSGPFVYGPNRMQAADGGVFVAQSAPVLVICGARLLGLHPARRSAWWDVAGAEPAPVLRQGARRTATLAWGTLIVETRGEDLVIAAGVDAHEAERGLALSAAKVVREAADHVARCDAAPNADPLLRSMAMQCAHAALSSIRADARGRFAGLAAGEAYSTPARTYYRDSYWTAQALLRLAPEAVREEIELLALGVQADGEAPSGLILTGRVQSGAWEAARRSSHDLAEAHQRPLDWWSDHFDSPLLFVLLLADYARASGDTALAHRHWPQVRSVFARYQALAAAGCGLPHKPRNDRDWADNVFREGLVAYDLGLWIGALDAVAEMGRAHDPTLAAAAAEAAAAGRAAIEAQLWLPEGRYADYVAPDGFVEDHLALDSLTLLRFEAVTSRRALAVLAAMAARLESRRNLAQPWGDWGVMCAYPPFKRAADLRAKSAFAFRYHNGADWPYLDGLYAGERLRRGLGGWRYPLLRWWETCLARGWLGAVEQFSPAFGRGSLLQAWSSLPLAAVLDHPAAVAAGDAEAPPA